MYQTMTVPVQVHPQIQPKSLGEQIVEVLQGEIIAGGIRPGERLVERELIKRFGVSSIPIREALQELENRGLVVKRHNCGCSVIQLSATEVARICELRRVLEPKVMEWAAERITAPAIEHLAGQLRRLEQAAGANDLAAFFQEDIVFHRMTWEAAGNPFAVRALETTLGSLFASGMIGSHKGRSIDLRDEWEKHRRLFDAVRERDSQRAALALLEIAAGFEKHLPCAVFT